MLLVASLRAVLSLASAYLANWIAAPLLFRKKVSPHDQSPSIRGLWAPFWSLELLQLARQVKLTSPRSNTPWVSSWAWSSPSRQPYLAYLQVSSSLPRAWTTSLPFLCLCTPPTSRTHHSRNHRSHPIALHRSSDTSCRQTSYCYNSALSRGSYSNSPL